MKKPYARIDFINCFLDYDYTFCEWRDVRGQLEIVESNFTDVDQLLFIHWKANGCLPEIKITLVVLTVRQFNNFMKKLEKNA